MNADLHEKSLIDMHVHIAAFRDDERGCFLHPKFEKGILPRYLTWKLKLKGATNREKNRSYVDRLKGEIRSSRYVQKAVILALDGIYDEAGRLDLEKTKLMVGNDYVLSLAKESPDIFIPAISINPQRRDAVEELRRVKEAGGKIIKVLPPSQNFDPANPRYDGFYEACAEIEMPILTHTGHEFSIPAVTQKYGEPWRWERALERGVTVVAAHAGSSGLFTAGEFFKRFLDLLKKYPNYYTDLSGATLPDRAFVLQKFKKHPEFFSRILYATDYPLSAYASSFIGTFPPGLQWRLMRMKSIFDKQALILHHLGFRYDLELPRKILKV